MFYATIRILFRIVALPFFRFRVKGASRVPRTGPGVVVATHRSWLDPACVGGACPRPVRFLINEDVYHKRWARWFYRRMRAIPVPGGGGRDAATAVRLALRHLEAEELVGVFPEGTVLPEGGIGKVHPGAAMLSVRTRAPVIPVAILGSARAWPPGRRWPGPARVRVTIGQPIPPPEGKADRQAVNEMVQRIEGALQRMEAGNHASHGRPEEGGDSTGWMRR